MVGRGVETCGSPGEVANEPARDHRLHMYLAEGVDSVDSLQSTYSKANGKSMVWTSIALKAADQLRQKMAFALSQIFVINDEANSYESEVYHNYYDIFVRNSFGSFRDILRQVSFSPLMGKYLTFLQNQALAYGGSFPDENYAR